MSFFLDFVILTFLLLQISHFLNLLIKKLQTQAIKFF